MQWKIAPRLGGWCPPTEASPDLEGDGSAPAAPTLVNGHVHRFSVPKQFGSLTLKCSVLQPLFEWELMQIFLWKIVMLCCRSYRWVRQGWFSGIWWQRCADSPGSWLWARPFWTLLPAVKSGHLVARSQSTTLWNARLLEVRWLDNVWLGSVHVLSGRGLFHRSPRYWCNRVLFVEATGFLMP